MEKLNTEDGQLFVKNLARFVRTHEKALANAMQMRRQASKSIDATQTTSSAHSSSTRSSAVSAASALAAALSLGSLSLTSHSIRPARLTLTPHHLFYLLSRFEDLSIPVGLMNIRLENISTESSSAYVSFLSKPQRPKGDRDSIHSVSSVRSVMSTMSTFWSSFGLGSKDSVSKSEKAKAAIEGDLKYLYSAFTKIPCLRLAPDHRARLIRGYEEFPFDTAVPLHSFKNLSALEIIDVDFRSFFGWDRMAEQLRSLTLKRAHLEDVGDLLTRIVLDDMEKSRRRSSKTQQQSSSSAHGWNSPNYSPAYPEPIKSISAPGSPVVDPCYGTSASPKGSTSMIRGGSEGGMGHARTGSISPTRPGSSRHGPRHIRGASSKIRRSGSGSSNSSETSSAIPRNRSMSNLLAGSSLTAFKWRFLRHLNLTDNSLTSISVESLAPVANTLHSLDLSWNLFTEVPDSLASLVSLRSLNLSHCMIDSLHSLSRSPLPAITSLNLRGNRLRSIAGVERLLSLERLDLRDNNILDPTEIARLTALPYIREIWISGNPFTKSYPGHRLTIFNLFRQTPGYSEDIFLDNSSPSYSERKQLVERVAEPEAAPVVRLPEEQDVVEPEITSKIHSKPHHHTPNVDAVPANPRPSGETQRDGYVGSTRRKRQHKKRIIDLTNDINATNSSNILEVEAAIPIPATEQPPPDTFISANPKEPVPEPKEPKPEVEPRYDTEPEPEDIKPTVKQPSIQSTVRVSSEPPIQPTVRVSSEPPIIPASVVDPPKGKTTLLPAIDGIDWEAGGDVYRQRLEALKQEVGTNWLAVLGDDTWANRSMDTSNLHLASPDYHSAANSIRPSPIARSSSQAIVTGGRTLG
ncbi:hypothetical protein FQN57_004543 [Myotisia sp. PD_48]|nr:hypothetical protein FQN57_004543 [Myotisia sp. PD_48]